MGRKKVNWSPVSWGSQGETALARCLPLCLSCLCLCPGPPPSARMWHLDARFAVCSPCVTFTLRSGLPGPAGRSSVTSLLEGLHPFLLGGTAWTWLLGTVSSAPWPLPCWNNWVPLSLSESLLRVCPLLHALTPRGDRALAMSVVQLRNLWYRRIR